MLLLFTLQRVSGQPQLVDDVTRDVGLHQLSFLGVILRSLQQVVKLFWIELLREEMTLKSCCQTAWTSIQRSIYWSVALFIFINGND